MSNDTNSYTTALHVKACVTFGTQVHIQAVHPWQLYLVFECHIYLCHSIGKLSPKISCERLSTDIKTKEIWSIRHICLTTVNYGCTEDFAFSHFDLSSNVYFFCNIFRNCSESFFNLEHFQRWEMWIRNRLFSYLKEI